MAHRLILVRHGQSTWNLENRFTGWRDVPLTDAGRAEAIAAAAELERAGVRPDVVHTSVLVRAIETANLLLGAAGLAWLPVRRSWRLNERHYGALEGLNKSETASRFGEDQVKIWRRSYDIPPPPLEPGDERHPARDPRYAALAPDLLPATECLADVLDRMLPYWYDALVPDLRTGATVLVAAHGNSLRALVKHLEGIPDGEIVELNIPTAVPRLYELDADLRVASVRYLGDPDAIAAKERSVAAQGSAKPTH